MHPFAETFADEDLLRSTLLGRRVHPDDISALLRYVPAALTHLCWRNSVIEDWHGGPDSRISDAEMMRANVATARVFHQALWYSVGDLWAELGPLPLDLVDTEALGAALTDALEAAFDPERPLPHGPTLGELGGRDYQDLRDHAEHQIGALLVMADEHGAHRVLMWLALRGALSVPAWWGTPQWPYIVDEFLRRLDDPEHDHWRVGGHPGRLPPGATDSSGFREMLLTAPDELPTEVIAFCIDKAGLGFVRIEQPSH